MNQPVLALREAFAVNAKLVTPVRGAVLATPVTLLFAVGLLGHESLTIIAMAIAANLIAIAALIGAPRLSLGLAVIDAIGMCAGTVLGSATADRPWLHAATLLLWSFATGFAVIFGQTQGIIGSQCIVAYVVLGRQGGSAHHIALVALAVLGGALTQIGALLVLRLPPTLRYQRQQLALAFEAIADYALADPSQSALTALAAIDNAQRVLAPLSLFGRSDVRDLQALVDQARRSRVELTAIAGLRIRLRDASHLSLDQDVASCLVLYAGALRDVANEIRTPTPNAPEPPQRMRERMAHLALEHASLSGDAAIMAAQCQTHLESLRGQLRSCRSLARSQQSEATTHIRIAATSSRRTVDQWTDRVVKIRTHWHLADSAFRHAVRLAIAVTLAFAVAQLLNLPRGYWVAFAVAVILKPDYSTTLRRGIGRTVGTAVGASVAALLEAELHPTLALNVLLVGIVATLAYAIWPASFAVAIGLISSLVLLMLSSTTHDAIPTAGDRLLDVALGAIIATAAYLLWPSSPATDLAQAQQEFLRALSAYGRCVLSQTVSSSALDEVSALSRRAQLCYARLESALGRALEEPSSIVAELDGVPEAVRNGLRAVRAIHALRLSAGRPADVSPALVTSYVETLERALAREPHASFALRRRYLAIEASSTGGRSDTPFLLTLDELTNAVDSL